MTRPTLAGYPAWLALQITPNRRRNFEQLYEIMHAKEFVFVIANDKNRVQDARDIRHEALREFGYKSYVDTDILGPISVLEIMIALSRRLSFMTSAPAEEWAWVLLQNLDLNGYSGHIGRRGAMEIDEVLEVLIWRKYSSNGNGGFFPLQFAREDQREVELWYQMSAYLAELDSA